MHSRFAIPLNPNDDSTCNILQGTKLAELIQKIKLIIWDEVPMMHRYCFDALDRALRDIVRLEDTIGCIQPFGRETVVFGGGFRQILLVIQKGSRQDIILATINSSYLWAHCKVLKLTKNMRLKNLVNDDCGLELKKFSDWILSIGDGTFGGDNDGHGRIEIPNDLLVRVSNNQVRSIVETTYPSFFGNFEDVACLNGRVILAPTLDLVQSINEYMVSMNKSDGRNYFSSDSLRRAKNSTGFFKEIHSTKFLNSIKCSGVPSHELMLKIGVPMMLLRNIDYAAGLCNGTRLIITRLGRHVIEAKIMSGSNAGDKVLLPRISLTPSDSKLPFKFQRKQFPLIVSYVITINKSQGQSLLHVGLFLKKLVFSHGQQCVAVSRVTNRVDLKILICDDEDKPTNVTNNVVYKEVFKKIVVL